MISNEWYSFEFIVSRKRSTNSKGQSLFIRIEFDFCTGVKMKKIVFQFAATVWLLLSFNSVMLFAQELIIPKTFQAPEIDGIMENSIWTNAAIVTGTTPVEIQPYITYGGINDASITSFLLWDTQNLYIFLEIVDDFLYQDVYDDDYAYFYWTNDAFEIYIDGLNDKSAETDGNDLQLIQIFEWDFLYQVGYRPTNWDSLNSGIQVAQRESFEGIDFEISIPFAELKVTNPADGTRLGLEIAYDDDDGEFPPEDHWFSIYGESFRDEKIMTFSDFDAWDQPAFWGTIVLQSVESTNTHDVGISNITVSSSVEKNETVTITANIKNYGTESQSNFPVRYKVGNNDPVTETYTGSIAPSENKSFTFSQTWTPSYSGTYTVEVSTQLSGDENPGNDAKTSSIKVNEPGGSLPTVLGTEKWSYFVGYHITSGFYSCPGIAEDGTIYVGEGTDNGRLVALNPDGTLKWEFDVDVETRSAPSIDPSGNIYFVTWDDTLYSLKPDGTVNWKFKSLSHGNQSPSFGPDGTVYLPTNGTSLFAINSNGSKKWEFSTGSSTYQSPAIASDGTVYIHSNDHYLYAINPNGTEKWRFETSDLDIHWLYDEDSGPAIGSDGTIYVGSTGGTLYAINPDGTQKWNFTPDLVSTPIWSCSPVIDADGVIYCSIKKYMFALNPDGTEKWHLSGEYYFSTPALGDNGALFVGTHNGRIAAINPDGTLNSTFKTDTRDGYNWNNAAIAIAADGTIYAGADDGYLYAINSTCHGLMDSPWPKYQCDSKNTGYNPENGASPVESSGSALVNDYQLLQNYPNPFNPSTTIPFQLSKPGHVVMKLYNLNGQQVETLTDSYYTAGSYEINFMAKGLASGIYLCRIEVNNYNQVRKIIYQK